ncbi:MULTISPECIES: tetratricopeptide repeat protein [Bacillus]|uniref:tetratricopeptide repeat protein n=1 Tax=Bacillus TaxID=1386 RepID=UPI000BA59730|nr:tetratricopeptide repeat protein [Bacillus safensis]MDI0274046.1 tetratricopeptide repeat protein [Bacillus safensis]OYN64303.1 aspartate phosphatase [Bacillus safensis]UXO87732.1 tetratricopeptide repeat protein [Bacillus safensis]WCL58004.1 tetratricopeptide repeat protein [Bacillus safensis]
MNFMSDKSIKKLLHSWYTMLKHRHFSKAEEIKKTLLKYKRKLSKKQELYLHYQLMLFRHQLWMNQTEDLEKLKHELLPHKDEMNEELQYYFYFFLGLYESLKSDQNDAIHYLEKAEERLPLLKDELEEAEFHFRTSGVYYNNRYSLLSIRHVQKAMDIFAKHEDIHSIYRCKIVLALNYSDQKKYEEAEDIFIEIIDYVKKIDDQELLGIVYYDAGFIQSRQNRHKEALEYFKKALRLPAYRKSAHSYVSCLYETVRSCFKENLTDEGMKYIQKGLKEAVASQFDILRMKFQILSLLYSQTPKADEQIATLVTCLERKEAWIDLEDLLADVSDYYKKKGDFERAAFFIMRG